MFDSLSDKKREKKTNKNFSWRLLKQTKINIY